MSITITGIMDGYEEEVHLVDDSMSGPEIHVTGLYESKNIKTASQLDTDNGSSTHNINDIDVGEVLVADGIAAETVVTTTGICSGLLSKDDSGDSGCGMEDCEEGSQFAEHDSTASSLGVLECDDIRLDPLQPPPFITTAWPSLELIKMNNKSDIADDVSSGESLVSFKLDALHTDSASDPQSTRDPSVRESTKREQDRLKKKKLREDPAYRQKEKERARVRMKLRRLDPVYRCNERQRDRQRRKAARVFNRVKEQERQTEEDALGSIEKGSGLLPLMGFEDYAVVETVPGHNQSVESVVLQFDGT